MMNYLSVVDTFFPDRPSGSARVAWDIAGIMKSNGYSVSFFCRKQLAQDEEIATLDGMKVVRFQFPRTTSLDPFKWRKQKQSGIKAAREHLTSVDWDIVHIHSPLQGSVAREVLGERPKYIYTVHSPMVMEQQVKWQHQGLPGRIKSLLGSGMLKSFERPLLMKADRIHTLSDYTRRCLMTAYPLDDKITVIPHWGDGFQRGQTKAKSRQILRWPPSGRFVLSVRRLAPRMGLDIALDAFADLLHNHPELHFILVGSGPLENKLKMLAEDLKISDQVWFLGRVSEETLRHCYEAADLFLLPTTALECFGLILLEAMGFGLPVVATDAGAIPEIMKPILPDHLVPAGNTEALRKKLNAWMNGDLTAPSGEGMIHYIRQKYSAEAIAPQIMALVQS